VEKDDKQRIQIRTTTYTIAHTISTDLPLRHLNSTSKRFENYEMRLLVT